MNCLKLGSQPIPVDHNASFNDSAILKRSRSVMLYIQSQPGQDTYVAGLPLRPSYIRAERFETALSFQEDKPASVTLSTGTNLLHRLNAFISNIFSVSICLILNAPMLSAAPTGRNEFSGKIKPIKTIFVVRRHRKFPFPKDLLWFLSILAFASSRSTLFNVLTLQNKTFTFYETGAEI